MAKPSNAVKDRWNAKAYDDIRVRVPKGRKAKIEAFAKKNGVSVNGLLNRLMREAMGLSEEEWKETEAE